MENVMYREAMNKLIEWKNSTNRLPLIIHGARQVGKTWLMKEFGKTHFKKYAYIEREFAPVERVWKRKCLIFSIRKFRPKSRLQRQRSVYGRCRQNNNFRIQRQ